MEEAGPGPCRLLLANALAARLRLPARSGEAPAIQHVEQLIGTNDIVGTGAINQDKLCGILFRVEPTALDIVRTQVATVTVLERSNGVTKLKLEEKIAVRVLDTAAIVQIVSP
jgi:hypothetical protein